MAQKCIANLEQHMHTDYAYVCNQQKNLYTVKNLVTCTLLIRKHHDED